jgi:2-polyprenyl-3-methyl-5-hydroxy-6-metoxy-1,4-benzoquinol methylase
MKSDKEFALTYRSVNNSVLVSIPKEARKILDVGCGTGELGGVVKSLKQCFITGLTLNPLEAELAKGRLDEVFLVDLNCIQCEDLGKYDCIICCHVLEHLYEPLPILRSLVKNCLTSDGTIIVALPNIVHWKSRLNLLMGRFRYADGGVMDRTHFRFFDWRTAAELVQGAGLQIETSFADGILPFSRLFGPYSSQINRHACTIWPGLFGWQFVFTAKASGNFEPSL